MKILMIVEAGFSYLTEVEYLLQNGLVNNTNYIQVLRTMPDKTWQVAKGAYSMLPFRFITDFRQINGVYDLVLLTRTDYATNIVDKVFKNHTNKRTKVVLTDEGMFSIRDLKSAVKYIRSKSIKDLQYFSIFDIEPQGCKIIDNDLRFLKDRSYSIDYHTDTKNKMVVIVGTGLLRKLPMNLIENYFKEVIDRTIERFPDDKIVYPYHPITRDEIIRLIEQRYKDKLMCLKTSLPTDVLFNDMNTKAVISTYSTVTASLNKMYGDNIEFYYPNTYNEKELLIGEKQNAAKGIEIAKDYQINKLKIKPLV